MIVRELRNGIADDGAPVVRPERSVRRAEVVRLGIAEPGTRREVAMLGRENAHPAGRCRDASGAWLYHRDAGRKVRHPPRPIACTGTFELLVPLVRGPNRALGHQPAKSRLKPS